MRPIDTALLLTLAGGLMVAGCAQKRRDVSPTLANRPPASATSARAGAPAGGMAGLWQAGDAGKALDRRDRELMQGATQQALARNKAGAASTWSNPASGHSGTVTPQGVFRGASGQTCREYHQTVSANGLTDTGYAAACRQPDGAWHIVKRG